MSKRAALLGFLIGDAIGVPFEFNTPEYLQGVPQKNFSLPTPTTNRSHHMAPPNAWSDDGAQVLALIDSLNRCQTLDVDDFGQALLDWQMHGKYAVDGVIFDIGIQTKRALQKLRNGTQAVCVDNTRVVRSPHNASTRFIDCGGELECHNGNGSLMRVLGLALWHTGSDKELIDFAYDQSLPTHAHVRSQVCCALYCLWVRNLLNGAEDGFEEAVQTFTDISTQLNDQASLDELQIVLNDQHLTPTGTGYVVDTVWSVRHAFVHSSSYPQAIETASRLGPDTDTVAAITGAVAAVKYGEDNIPQLWRDTLATDPMLTLCLNVVAPKPPTARL